jgi:hypothetical protein
MNKKPYFSTKKYVKWMEANNLPELMGDMVLDKLDPIEGYENWYDNAENKELFRPFIFFGNYRIKDKKYRWKYSIEEKWIEWR